jgi:hypothetical protein
MAIDKTLGPKWEVQGDYFARREDGVMAEHVFSGARPFVAKRVIKKKLEWLAGHKGRHSDSPRAFGSLATAMKAADKHWPIKAVPRMTAREVPTL